MTHHRRGLRRLLKNDTLLTEVEADWRSAQLSPQRLAMLTFAAKLTHNPGSMDGHDVERLKMHGFSDRDILDIVEVTAYYAYANRIADGLGISTEPWIPDDA